MSFRTTGKANSVVILASPVPPPEGGIANWTRHIISSPELAKHFKIELLNTSPHSDAGQRNTIYNCKVLLRIIEQAKRIFRSVDSADRLVLHECTSGGMGFVRDLVLGHIAHRNGASCILHLHFGRVPQLLKTSSAEALLLRVLLKQYDMVLSIDSPTTEALKREKIDCQVVEVPNPIDISQRIVVPIDEKNDEVIYVGHVNQNKGIEILLHAWAKIRKADSNWRLTVVGPCDEEYLSLLKKRFSTEDVTFLGKVDHRKTLYLIAHAKCLVLPSYTEGFPNVILEAMLLGTPIIASKVGAIPQMLYENCGTLIEPGNVDDLVQKLERLMSKFDDAVSAASNAYERVNNEYSLESVSQKIMVCWQSVQAHRSY